MIRLADYIAKYVADSGIDTVFMITGGGAMHLNDAFGFEPRLHCIFNHHEQASAIAAEGYARVTGKPALVNVTSGPGGINALNGVFGAWTDSVPMLIVSGQVKRQTVKGLNGLDGLRQMGDQEVDIISMVKGITKYSVLVEDPNSIRYHLEKALFLAKNGRPGPCWLDIPVDVQAAQIDESQLAGYLPEFVPPFSYQSEVDAIFAALETAKRPILLVGNGVRCANRGKELNSLVEQIKVPVVTTRTALDLLPYESEFFVGRSGIDADRAGNFAVQNSDLLLILGSRLGVRQIGYSFNAFAPNAQIIHVDIDPLELNKPTLHSSKKIQADLNEFLPLLLKSAKNRISTPKEAWLKKCREYKKKFTGILPYIGKAADSKELNPYIFASTLSDNLRNDDAVICGNGSAFIMTFQVAQVKMGQRWIFNSGCASMGYDLPAALGACIGRSGARTICMAGDGSIMMNLQELATIAARKLPIKIFVYCNNGYLSIHQSQKTFFKRFVGESKLSGLELPKIGNLAEAFGCKTFTITKDNYQQIIPLVLDFPGPVLCEVLVDPEQEFEPRSSSKQMPDGKIISPPLEDMYPFLDRDEFARNMIVPDLQKGDMEDK